MNWLAGFVCALVVFPALAGDKITALKVDGTAYTEIEDVHVASGGRIVILYSGGGTTLDAGQLPKAFLDSWDITPARIAAAKTAGKRQSEQSIQQAIADGYFREVEGVVYDLRKPQPSWLRITGGKILQIIQDGALLDLSTIPGNPAVIFVRNLPPGLSDHDIVTVVAKSTGSFSFLDRSNFERTIRSYDMGHVCKREQIPAAMLEEGLAEMALPDAPKPHDHGIPSLAGHDRVRAIGSGFFVSKDGYLVTNHHVVKEAESIEIKYQGNVLPAKVVQVDKDNDLAVLKVEGRNFQPLAIARDDSAVSLGEEVFTIGFPNIQMQGVEPKYTDGKISSLKGMQDDPHEYQISVPVQPGNSGGPLCDANGQVVGIIVARINDFAVLQASGVMPQNVNYAIKSSHALQLLQTIKGLEQATAAAPNPGNAVKTVENAIVMVMIH